MRFPRHFLIVFTLVAIVPSATAEDELQRFEAAHRAMGSVFQITAYADDQATAGKAIRAAFDRIDALDARLSDYHSTSELSKLSATAPSTEPVKVSDDLFRILVASQRLSERSDGAFDITIGPLTTLWRTSRRERKLPPSEVLTTAKAAVGYQHIQIDHQTQTVRLTQPNMRLDLGGIAKGFAADEALAVLKAHGVASALVNCSGDMAIGNAPPDRNGWTIGVAPLAEGGQPSVLFSLKNCAIATSGDAFQFVEIDGQRYSHIVSPKTGLGLTDRSSVTVVANSGMQADGLASAVSVLGGEAGLKLIEQTPGAAALHLTIEDDQPVKRQTSRLKNLILNDESPPRTNDPPSEPKPQPPESQTYGGIPLRQWRARFGDFDTSSPAAAAAVPALIQIAKDQNLDDLTRRQAALVLGRIGKPAKAAVPTLTQIARSEISGDSPNAIWAIKSLALMGAEARDATDTLVHIINDTDQPWGVRQMTVEALGQIGGAHPDAVPALIQLLNSPPVSRENDQSQQLRLLAVEALGLAGNDAAVAAPLLIRILRSPDESPWLRRQAAASLGSLGDRAAVAIGPLIETLEFDSSEPVRDAAAESLATFSPISLPHLQQLLAHPDASVRWRAAKAIGQVDPPAASSLPSLRLRLRDKNALVRITAAESSWAIEPDAAPLLGTTVNLLTEEDRQIRIRALNLITEFGTQAREATSQLQAMQRDPRREVSRVASQALSNLGN